MDIDQADACQVSYLSIQNIKYIIQYYSKLEFLGRLLCWPKKHFRNMMITTMTVVMTDLNSILTIVMDVGVNIVKFFFVRKRSV